MKLITLPELIPLVTAYIVITINFMRTQPVVFFIAVPATPVAFPGILLIISVRP